MEFRIYVGGGGRGVGLEIRQIVGTLLKNHYLCHCQAFNLGWQFTCNINYGKNILSFKTVSVFFSAVTLYIRNSSGIAYVLKHCQVYTCYVYILPFSVKTQTSDTSCIAPLKLSHSFLLTSIFDIMHSLVCISDTVMHSSLTYKGSVMLSFPTHPVLPCIPLRCT